MKFVIESVVTNAATGHVAISHQEVAMNLGHMAPRKRQEWSKHVLSSLSKQTKNTEKVTDNIFVKTRILAFDSVEVDDVISPEPFTFSQPERKPIIIDAAEAPELAEEQVATAIRAISGRPEKISVVRKHLPTFCKVYDFLRGK